MTAPEQIKSNQAAPHWKRHIVVLLVLQVLVGSVYLGTVPSYFLDEAWDSALGCSLACSGSLKHPFIEGLGGIHVHFVQNRVVLALVSAVVFKIADYSVATSRIGSLIFGAVAVVCLYGVARRWFGENQALWIALATVVHPWFFDICRRARPEIYYTALAIAFLWCLLVYFDSGARLAGLLAGVLAGLAGLTHANGLIVVFSIGCAAVLWLRVRPIGRLIVWGAIGFVLIVLPWAIYVLWAIQDPEVSLTNQMYANLLMRTSVLHNEILRWKSFLKWPKGVGLGVLMLVSWILAWYRSTRAEKTVATAIGLFTLILPFLSIQADDRYIAAMVPLFSVLIIRLIWRVTRTQGSGISEIWHRCRIALGLGVAAIYFVAHIAAIGLMFYYFRGADLTRVTDRVATVVGPESRVYGAPVFWVGHKRYHYGPYPITPVLHEGIHLAEGIEMLRKYRFDHAVRTAWAFVPDGILRPPRSMPKFRDDILVDHTCRLFGTKVDEFYDPYYGPIEIYKLDWDRPLWY